MCTGYLLAVLLIHDILVCIRIRGSMPLTNGSGSFHFHHWPSRCQQKTNLQSFSAYYLLKSIFKDKKTKRRHKTVEIKIFLILFLLNDRRIRSRIQEAHKHVDPDSDPQHCLLEISRRWSILKGLDILSEITWYFANHTICGFDARTSPGESRRGLKQSTPRLKM
jgi:hypothetical protein